MILNLMKFQLFEEGEGEMKLMKLLCCVLVFWNISWAIDFTPNREELELVKSAFKELGDIATDIYEGKFQLLTSNEMIEVYKRDKRMSELLFCLRDLNAEELSYVAENVKNYCNADAYAYWSVLDASLMKSAKPFADGKVSLYDIFDARLFETLNVYSKILLFARMENEKKEAVK